MSVMVNELAHSRKSCRENFLPQKNHVALVVGDVVNACSTLSTAVTMTQAKRFMGCVNITGALRLYLLFWFGVVPFPFLDVSKKEQLIPS